MIFGIGTDIVEVERIQQSLNQFGDDFAIRILADTELPDYRETKLKARFLAKRFAAKEAFSKAMGTGIRGEVSFRNIAVGHDDLGKPVFVLSTSLMAILNQQGVVTSHISISDEKNFAVAFVVLEN